MTHEITREQLNEIVVETGLNEADVQLMATWLDRGDGIAIYRNVDFGSLGLGHRQFLSYGSEQAQLETDVPPVQLPDIGSAINWRYRLEGHYRLQERRDG